jgi:uncharacterized protein (TIGR00369 family)
LEQTIPEGFAPWPRGSGPVTQAWEPIYARDEENSYALGLNIGAAHHNGRGLLHGGVIATLCDVATGRCCVARLHRQGVAVSGLLTTQLSVDYIDKADSGWLQVDCEIIFAGRSTALTACTVTVDGRIVAHAKAAFRILADRNSA